MDKNQGFTGRTTNIRLKYHYVRECHNAKMIMLMKIGTKDNIADILTKALGKRQNYFLCKLIFDVGDSSLFAFQIKD